MPEHVMLFGRAEDFASRMRAVAPDVSTTLMCRFEHLSRIADPGVCSRIVALPMETTASEWVSMARAVHAMHPVTRIAVFGEQDPEMAALVGSDLGIPTHSLDTVQWVIDKHQMRLRLRAVGVDDTPSAMVRGWEELGAFADEHGFPVVVKPIGASSSLGISVVHAERELERAFHRAATEYEGVRLSGVVAERFHVGPQYSVEAFSEDGEHVPVAITRKYSDTSSFAEIGFLMPAPLTRNQEAQIHTFACRILDALGVRFGPTHTEFVLTESGPKLIETHIRVGEMFALAKDAVGVDLLDYQIRQTLGERVLPEMRARLRIGAAERRFEAIWYATTDAGGQLVRVMGADAHASGAKNVLVEVLATPGAQLEGWSSNHSKVAQARAHASDPDTALAAAQAAINSLVFYTQAPAAQPTYF